MTAALSNPAPWYVAGPLIGVTIVLLLWLTNRPLGALGGYIELAEWSLRKRTAPGWRIWFLGGIVAGGVASSVIVSAWQPTLAYGSFDRALGATLPLKAITLFGAGLAMGAGGRMAGGCTSGHGLCGTSFGSPASFVCTATFMVTAIAVAFGIAWIFGA